MKKFVFFSLPSHGHTNPVLNVARELARQGNAVIFYSFKEFKQVIESAGVTYRRYDEQYTFDPRISKNISVFAKKLIEVTEHGLPALLPEIEKEKPDCILHDTLAVWGKIIANNLHIPAVSLFTTFAFNNKLAVKYPQMYIPMLINALLRGYHGVHAMTKYRLLIKKYGLKFHNRRGFLLSQENLNIVFTSSYFQPYAENFPHSFKFVGPSLYPRNEKADFLQKIARNKKHIYISTGTIFNDNLAFYHLCLETFKNTPYQVVVSLGHRFTLSDLPAIPENFIVKNHIPQLEVLQKADVFITHAGMNSINESLYYGVPMVLIPRLHEQTLNAIRVQELGAGIYLKKNKLNQKLLLQTTEQILTTKSFYTHAAKIQKTLKDAGGYKKAVEEIIHYLQ